MRLSIILLLSVITINAEAQQTLRVKVSGGESTMPISASIIIKGSSGGYPADTSGATVISFPVNGKYTLLISAIGYKDK